jgi:hypothetical protein
MVKMSDIDNRRLDKLGQYAVPPTKEIDKGVNRLCQRALAEAKHQLHPLLQNIELNRLDQRREFLQTFKFALEQQIARTLVVWYPDIQAIFRYDATPNKNTEDWDGTIHLLAKVPRLSKQLKALSNKLDNGLVKCIKRWNWSRFDKSQTILDVQQVTPNELRHGTGYGAMFCAVYTVPVQVWPLDSRAG